MEHAAGMGALSALAGPMAALAPMLRTLGVIAIGVGGCMLFAMIGSMSYPGVGAILGAVFGFALFSCIGFVVLGKYKDVVRGGSDLIDLPGFASEHSPFVLIITVHRVTAIDEEKLCGVGAGSRDTFVQVKCGINPPKSTCVKTDGVWNESFKMNVRRKDKSVMVVLLDQNIFGDSVLGQVTLDIDDDIVDRGFPHKEKYKVEVTSTEKEAPKAMLELSFDQQDFPEDRLAHLETIHPHQFEKRRQSQALASKQWKRLSSYGTLAPQMNFNQTDPESMPEVKKLQQDRETQQLIKNQV